jgi:putative DNA primase/helicase
VSIEVEEGKRLAESLIKILTGGDTVCARFLYAPEFEFTPQFKLWLAANEAPRIRDDDNALWRRILRVPFEHTIPEAERDPQVKLTLKDPEKAGPAILAWAVQGCLKWQASGLKPPSSITTATTQFREEQDPLRDFLEECSEFNIGAIIPVTELRAAYDEWAKANGIRYPLGLKKFNRCLERKGCTKKTTNYVNDLGTERNGKCWHGVTLLRKSQYIEPIDDRPGNELLI